jgi:hypothetical protein
MIKSRRIIWAWHVVRMGEMRNTCRILVAKLNSKRALQGLTARWGCRPNTEIDVKRMGCEGINWIYLAQDR